MQAAVTMTNTRMKVSNLADSAGHNLPSTVFRNAEYTFTCTLGVKKVSYCLKTIKKYNNHRVSLL
ncbi:group-specific protein [Bacillus cereus E33L]|uniref:Group-specific protein n=1 Tax=Bacillus cereus (strain ZK / E33L) TaxID=288681 RepID=Q63F32_BACCZ|nr:group-specific protein [Bacillus cereus E33L]